MSNGGAGAAGAAIGAASGSEDTRRVRDWVARIQRHDLAAQEELFRHFDSRLRELIQRMLRQHRRVARWETVDDVFQEAGIRLTRALTTMGDPPKTANGLFDLIACLAMRVLLNLGRKHKRSLSPSQAGAGGRSNASGSQGPGNPADLSALSPSSAMALAEDRSMFWPDFHQEIRLLPNKQRHVFILRWYGEADYSEIASLLEITEEAARKNWSLAAKTLHGRMRERHPEFVARVVGRPRRPKLAAPEPAASPIGPPPTEGGSS